MSSPGNVDPEDTHAAAGADATTSLRLTATSPGTPASAERAWEVCPPQIPGYERVREIHRGGQGIVYEAVQASTGRTVAVKLMREGPFATAAERARFDREIQTLLQLDHPNIVAIYDTGVTAGCHYFVMDYVAGAPLD